MPTISERQLFIQEILNDLDEISGKDLDAESSDSGSSQSQSDSDSSSLSSSSSSSTASTGTSIRKTSNCTLVTLTLRIDTLSNFNFGWDNYCQLSLLEHQLLSKQAASTADRPNKDGPCC